MALIRCKECGKEISGTAESCPHCGYKTAHGQKIAQNKVLGVQLLLHVACIAIGFILVVCNASTFFELYDNWEYVNKYWYEISFVKYLSNKEEMDIFWKMLIGSIMLLGGIIDAVVVYLKLSNNTQISQQYGSEVMQVRSDDWNCTCGGDKNSSEGTIAESAVPERWRCVECGMENMLNVKTCQNCGVTKEWSDAQRR